MFCFTDSEYKKNGNNAHGLDNLFSLNLKANNFYWLVITMFEAKLTNKGKTKTIFDFLDLCILEGNFTT